MATYRYKGLSPDGAKVSGVIQAYDEYEAVSRLRQSCSVITKIEEVKEQKQTFTPTIGKFKLKDKELAIICSQFSIILSSGLSIVRCVEMVAAQAKRKEVQSMLRKVAQDVSGGHSLASSFENNCPTLPATFVETIRAGEMSGTLELCFQRLHSYFDKSAKTKAKIASALTYPAMVVTVAIIVFIIIMVVAVPMFTKTFQEMGTELPGITKALIAVSDFLSGQWWIIALAALLLWIGRILLKRSRKGKLWLAKNKLLLSPLKSLHMMRAASQFASTMATMLASGLPLTTALETTANVISNEMLSLATRSVKQGVEQGKGLAECMSQCPYYPKVLTEMTGVGESAGNLEDTLSVIADYMNNEVELRTNRLLSLLEPCITIGLAAMTVILLLAVYLPMFSMYGGM